MITTEVRIMKWGFSLLAIAALFVSLIVTMRAFDSMDRATEVGSASLTQATLAVPQPTAATQLAQPPPLSSNGQVDMKDPGQAELIPPNEAHTTSATMYIPEGSDPDKPVQAPDNAAP